MIDINISLLYQLVNFIVLLIALNVILFKPIRRIMQERAQGVSAAFNDAKTAQERVQSLLEQYNASLAEAKQKATATYTTSYQQGLDAQRDMIAAERTRVRASRQGAGGDHGSVRLHTGRAPERGGAAVPGNYPQTAREGRVAMTKGVDAVIKRSCRFFPPFRQRFMPRRCLRRTRPTAGTPRRSRSSATGSPAD